MADYWVSRDKYYCKYCKIYIADDKPSRIQHETGLRHKGNYERYIRDVYKKGMQQKKDRVEEAQEVARVEAAAAAAMGTEPPPPVPSASSSKPKPAAVSSDPYANYTTAEFLGIKDDAAEKAAAEAELRQKEGRIGEWQRVVKPAPTFTPPPAEAAKVKGKGKARNEGFVGQAVLGSAAAAPLKREDGADEEQKPDVAQGVAPAVPAPAGDAEGVDEETSVSKKRGYFQERTLALDDDDDPYLASLGAGTIKVKKRRLTVKEQQAEEEERARVEAEREAARVKAQEQRGAKGQWEAVELEEQPMLEFDTPAAAGEGAEQDKAAADNSELAGADGEEQPKPTTGSGFKKRKMHGAAAARKK
ncbi:hypothetical protein Rhopal_000045-T1 [Rhodotorula paludigena]|uniref:Matrin-type domain-containing protein n=1 Tax=Rhodotorula paludigena TaxID=86838 RepID=A0AAV5GBF5_9BASI|nr:hypothetical protein Rhopal_000045-T1 [Rhodotorula paludigena]